MMESEVENDYCANKRITAITAMILMLRMSARKTTNRARKGKTTRYENGAQAAHLASHLLVFFFISLNISSRGPNSRRRSLLSFSRHQDSLPTLPARVHSPQTSRSCMHRQEGTLSLLLLFVGAPTANDPAAAASPAASPAVAAKSGEWSEREMSERNA